jgi:hypothetical protein
VLDDGDGDGSRQVLVVVVGRGWWIQGAKMLGPRNTGGWPHSIVHGRDGNN